MIRGAWSSGGRCTFPRRSTQEFGAEEQHKESVTAAFERYQQALRQLSADIDKRNKQRERPFQTFNPTLLNVSVST